MDQLNELALTSRNTTEEYLVDSVIVILHLLKI